LARSVRWRSAARVGGGLGVFCNMLQCTPRDGAAKKDERVGFAAGPKLEGTTMKTDEDYVTNTDDDYATAICCSNSKCEQNVPIGFVGKVYVEWSIDLPGDLEDADEAREMKRNGCVGEMFCSWACAAKWFAERAARERARDQ
jgi:hypothetical protein